MKQVLTIAAICLIATPAIGDEVSNQTLSQLGLSDLQAVSDDQGMEVRGFGGYWNKHNSGKGGGAHAVTSGTSLVFGQLVADLPTGTNFLVLSDVNHAYDSAWSGHSSAKAAHLHGSAIDGALVIPIEHGFEGYVTGFAGKAASPWGGFANAYAR